MWSLKNFVFLMWDFNDLWSLTGRIYKRTPKHDCKNVTKSCDLSFIWTWTAYYNGTSSKYSMWMIAIFCYTCVSDQLRIPKVTLLNSCSFLWWSLNRLLKSFTSVSTFSFFFFLSGWNIIQIFKRRYRRKWTSNWGKNITRTLDNIVLRNLIFILLPPPLYRWQQEVLNSV